MRMDVEFSTLDPDFFRSLIRKLGPVMKQDPARRGR
jgi:hypothetical protein